MICIAAFIILLVIWLFVPVIKLLGFKKQAKNINEMFKKSMHCFTRRVTFRPCDTNFTDEIKQSVLKKVVVNHKKWVKPISVMIEVLAWLIVVISVWSILTLIKSGIAIYVYGTCDVKKPEACALSSSEACSIDAVEGGNPVVDWFTEWGDLAEALPTRIKTWDEAKFVPENATYYERSPSGPDDNSPIAIDIFDPGCVICRKTFVNQREDGFYKGRRMYVIPYVIRNDGKDKFSNSELIARYIEAVRGKQPANAKHKVSAEWIIIENLFTEKNEDGEVWQQVFNGELGKPASEQKVKDTIRKWFKNKNFTDEEVDKFEKSLNSDEVSKRLENNRNVVDNELKAKLIPTSIYDGKIHEGLYKPKK